MTNQRNIEMHQVQISMEGDDESWRQRCYNRMEILKAKEFPPSHQEELFGEKKSVRFELQKAVQNGSVDKFMGVLERVSEKKLLLSDVVHQVTCSGDSLLHEAAYFGRTNIAELISHHFPELLTKTNKKGDTPLHVTARAKSSNVVRLILSQYDAHKSKSSTENHKERILITRMTNEYGNMALHEAVCSKDLESVTLLIRADQSVAHELNKSGKSPLYLAVMTSHKEIIDILLEAPFPYDKSCHGNSPLHAAIYKRNSDLLKEITEKKSDLVYARDEHGGTLLHYAAESGYIEAVRLLLKKYPLAALEWNTKGHLPIHLACKWGYIEVLKEFLEQEWVDPRVMLNKKGQNILHIAAKSGRDSEVIYLLKHTKLDQLIVNEKDNDGNTPLHLAAINFYPRILFYLTQDERIDMNLMNNEGLTARDTLLVKSQIPMTRTQRLSNLILSSAGAEKSDKAKGMLRRRRVPLPPKLDRIKDRMNTLMLVAVFIVTVTFAAGFTVPGGLYGSDDPNPHNRGMAVLAHRRIFQIFVLFNTIAMYSSIFGSFLLMWAQLGDVHLAVKSLNAALYMVGLALLTMTLAFMSAVSLVVSNVSWLAIVVAAIGIISFLLILGFWIFEVLPIGIRKPLLRLVGNSVIRIVVLFYRSTPKVKTHKLQTAAAQEPSFPTRV